jgi:hypothetical protein
MTGALLIVVPMLALFVMAGGGGGGRINHRPTTPRPPAPRSQVAPR